MFAGCSRRRHEYAHGPHQLFLRPNSQDLVDAGLEQTTFVDREVLSK